MRGLPLFLLSKHRRLGLAALLVALSALFAPLGWHGDVRADTAAPGWTVVKVAGIALVARVEREWRPLQAGDELGELDMIRTAASGKVEMRHGEDVVSVDPNSMLSIAELGEENGGGLTRLMHHLGNIFVEVEARPGRKFQVDTPYLTAVVKGTGFIVSVDQDGAAVAVEHGTVGVSDRHGQSQKDVTAGETGRVSAAAGSKVAVGPSDDVTRSAVGRGVAAEDDEAAGGSGAHGQGAGNEGDGAGGSSDGKSDRDKNDKDKSDKDRGGKDKSGKDKGGKDKSGKDKGSKDKGGKDKK